MKKFKTQWMTEPPAIQACLVDWTGLTVKVSTVVRWGAKDIEGWSTTTLQCLQLSSACIHDCQLAAWYSKFRRGHCQISKFPTPRHGQREVWPRCCGKNWTLATTLRPSNSKCDNILPHVLNLIWKNLHLDQLRGCWSSKLPRCESQSWWGNPQYIAFCFEL